jgi:hypothetical protein
MLPPCPIYCIGNELLLFFDHAPKERGKIICAIN